MAEVMSLVMDRTKLGWGALMLTTKSAVQGPPPDPEMSRWKLMGPAVASGATVML